MKVLDLFAGLGGWSAPWLRDHDVVRIDSRKQYDPEIVMDILDFDIHTLGSWRPDVVLASPPCEGFSVGSQGTHWNWHNEPLPRTDTAHLGLALVQKTREIIAMLEPDVAVIENPRGTLRKLSVMPSAPVTVWLCHYGGRSAKPTDLWGWPFPKYWRPRPRCHIRNPRTWHGELCCCLDHTAAPRGSHQGTQGRAHSAFKAEIPWGLAKSIQVAYLKQL